MDSTPAAAPGAPGRSLPGAPGRSLPGASPSTSPSIGVPSIPARTEQDTPPVPVPSIELPDGAVEPVPVPSVPTTESRRGDDRQAEPDGLSADGVESFAPAVRARLKSYVYLLVDPRTGKPFFVGRGQDDRCFDHVRAARQHRTSAGPGEEPAGGRDEFSELERIRRVERSGRRVRIDILRHGLEPDVAATVEAAAHDLLGLAGRPSGDSQRRSAAEVGLLLTKRAKFKRGHQVVLLRVPPGADTSYGRVRHGWRIGRRWVDVTAPRAPKWAVVVAGELVDSVYRLDRWEAEEPGEAGSAPGGTGARQAVRYSFVGTRDVELEGRYVGKSAAPYLRSGPPGSVAYVWCGPHWVNSAR